jgi:ABC-type transporter Mla MlaB component
VSLPRLTKVLDHLPAAGSIRLDVAGLDKVDHTCAEVLADWIQRKRRAGVRLELAGIDQRAGAGHYRRLAEAAAS